MDSKDWIHTLREVAMLVSMTTLVKKERLNRSSQIWIALIACDSEWTIDLYCEREREAGVCDESRCQNKGASDESRPIFSKGDGLGLSSFVAIATTAVVVARWGFWSLDNLWSVLRRTL